MNKYTAEALAKLKKELPEIKGSKESAMKKAVAEALESFCRQDDGFAQAVVLGGSFPACMKAVAKGVGGSISDLDAYKKAVKFYFPEAEVRFTMTVETGRGAHSGDALPVVPEPAVPASRKILDLTDFL